MDQQKAKDSDPVRRTIEAAREKAFILYEGVQTPHRSCGIAIAETFGFPSGPYQSLRKGGITGCGECGAIVAGRLILGQMLGDPNPTGGVTPELRSAMEDFEACWRKRIDRGNAPADSIVCSDLTGQFVEFRSEERAHFCTSIAATVASICAEVALRHGYEVKIPPIEDTTDAEV